MVTMTMIYGCYGFRNMVVVNIVCISGSVCLGNDNRHEHGHGYVTFVTRNMGTDPGSR